VPDPWAGAESGQPTSPASAPRAAWARWRAISDADRRGLVALAAGLAVTVVPRLAFPPAADAIGASEATWGPPLDRLTSTAGLIGIALLAGADRGRRTALGLGAAGVAAAAAWLAWLAADLAARPVGAGAAVAWDLGLLGLAALVLAALAREPRRAPPWLLAAVGLLATGSAWDAVAGAGGALPLAARGARAASACAGALGIGAALAAGGRAARDGGAARLGAAVDRELGRVAASIAGYRELLGEEAARAADPSLERHLDAVVAQAHRLEVLTACSTALLDGRPAARAADADDGLQRAVESAFARARAQFQVKSVRAECHAALEAAGEPPDAATFGLIVDNLLLGAVHRSPYGAPLELRAAAGDGTITIEVDYQDTTGAAEGPLDADDEPAAHLGVAAHLVERLGGTAWRTPALGGGRQRLVARLPAAPPRPGAAPAPTSAKRAP